jgi:predicted Holliday junction resolvase-like endonuclease
MVEIVVVIFLLIALVCLLVQNGRLREYKGTHIYTKTDVDRARKQSVSGSRSVNNGKIQEHLAPLFPEFAERFDLSDARFLGAPIDYIVFRGLSEDRVDEIVFLDVKTGQASLSKRQQAIRAAINERRVSFETLKLKGLAPEPDEERLPPDGQVEWLGSFDFVNGLLVKIRDE